LNFPHDIRWGEKRQQILTYTENHFGKIKSSKSPLKMVIIVNYATLAECAQLNINTGALRKMITRVRLCHQFCKHPQEIVASLLDLKWSTIKRQISIWKKNATLKEMSTGKDKY